LGAILSDDSFILHNDKKDKIAKKITAPNTLTRENFYYSIGCLYNVICSIYIHKQKNPNIVPKIRKIAKKLESIIFKIYPDFATSPKPDLFTIADYIIGQNFDEPITLSNGPLYQLVDHRTQNWGYSGKPTRIDPRHRYSRGNRTY
jgi:hypothetical protein